jgi:hypothetical protein
MASLALLMVLAAVVELPAAVPAVGRGELIEITLSYGLRVRVDAQVDGDACFAPPTRARCRAYHTNRLSPQPPSPICPDNIIGRYRSRLGSTAIAIAEKALLRPFLHTCDQLLSLEG